MHISEQITLNERGKEKGEEWQGRRKREGQKDCRSKIIELLMNGVVRVDNGTNCIIL